MVRVLISTQKVTSITDSLLLDVDTSNGYYNALLDLIDRLFDGDIDQTMFEEKARYLFATEVYVLFTIDKLVHSIIKQVCFLG